MPRSGALSSSAGCSTRSGCTPGTPSRPTTTQTWESPGFSCSTPGAAVSSASTTPAFASERSRGDATRRSSAGRTRTGRRGAMRNATEMPDAETALEHAKWIWYREGTSEVSAPVGKRYFRRSFTLEGKAGIESALVSMTADNSFELWVNGREVGRGDNFHEAAVLDIKPMLLTGVNVLAVVAENGGTAPNPAGLIGTLIIKYRDGQKLTVTTDKDWHSAQDRKSV